MVGNYRKVVLNITKACHLLKMKGEKMKEDI